MDLSNVSLKLSFNGELRRISVPKAEVTYQGLRDVVEHNLSLAPDFQLHYVDGDGDKIAVKGDDDLKEAIRYMNTKKKPDEDILTLSIVVSGSVRPKEQGKSGLSYIQTEAERFADTVADAVHADALLDKIESFASSISSGVGTVVGKAKEKSTWAAVRSNVLQTKDNVVGSTRNLFSGVVQSNQQGKDGSEGEDIIEPKQGKKEETTGASTKSLEEVMDAHSSPETMPVVGGAEPAKSQPESS